jgi:hypothetical protein
MTWAKRLIIALGLMLLTHVAHARGIESFTDSQGTLHITNLGPKKPDSPVNPPSPEASLAPRSLRGNAPVPPPDQQPAQPVPVPTPEPEPELEPEPGAVPNEPRPADPRPGARVTHTDGSAAVMQVAGRTGEKARPGGAAEAPAAHLQRVSWSPPQPGRMVSNGGIAVHRDRQGVIHITNVPLADEGQVARMSPAPALQRRGPPPTGDSPAVQKVSWPVPAPAVVQGQGPLLAAAFPAVQEVSCPELGPEVADYLEAKLRGLSAASTGETIHRTQDHRGVWHIVNEPAPDRQLSQAPLGAAAGQITAPASTQASPVTPTAPAMAWGPGSDRPPTGPSDQRVVARRDRRGVLQIFTRNSAEFVSNQDNPVHFLGKVSPALQSCIIEAAQRYRLPIPLILAIIRQESDFTYQAVSPKGAMGLMQLMPGTAAALGVRDPFDPRENILAGCRYFRFLLDYFQGSVPLALAGYNAGHHRVISAGFQVPAIKETQDFVTQVMGLYFLLEKHAAGL